VSTSAIKRDPDLHANESISIVNPKAPTSLEILALVKAIGKVYAARARAMSNIEDAIKSQIDSGKEPTIEQLHRVEYLANIGASEGGCDMRDDILGENQTALWLAARVMAGDEDMSS
jgi:hypothetical protein